MNDYISGLIGGTCGLAVGYPLDTIKALIQTRNHNSILDSAKIMFRQSNSRGLFRGMTLPFLSYGPINSFLFGIYGNSLRFFNNNNQDSPLLNCFLAGTIAGVITTIPNNPLELVKIQLQTHGQKEISGLADCLKQIYKINGFSGYFKGFSALLYRDSFSYGLYFLSFEYLRRKCKARDIDNEILIDFYCGGTAGSLAWLSILPIDVVKSRMQANRFEKQTFMECFRLIYQDHGIRGYFKGGVPMIIRGFLVSSVTFCVHFQVLKLIS